MVHHTKEKITSDMIQRLASVHIYENRLKAVPNEPNENHDS